MKSKKWLTAPCQICGDHVYRLGKNYRELDDADVFATGVAHEECYSLDKARQKALVADRPDTKVEFIIRSKILGAYTNLTKIKQTGERVRKAELQSQPRKVKVVKNR